MSVQLTGVSVHGGDVGGRAEPRSVGQRYVLGEAASLRDKGYPPS